MEKDSVTLSYKQIGAIVLVLMNLIIIGPGGWILKTLWNDTKTFRLETKETLDDLQKQIGEVRVDVSSNYVTEQAFIGYREQMAESIRYLDSKVANTNN